LRVEEKAAMDSIVVLDREDRRRRFGFDCPSELHWHGWETGGEYVKKITLKNISRTKTQRIKYKLPDSKIFSMKFPEQIKLSPGMSAKIDVTFRPTKREECTDVIEFMADIGSFFVRVKATLPETSLRNPSNLDLGFSAVKETAVAEFLLVNDGELAADFNWEVLAPFELLPSKGRLSPGQEVKMTCNFLPMDAGVFVQEALCKFSGGKKKEIKLSGIGKYPYIVTEETELDFGDVVVGEEKEMTLSILNQSLVEGNVTVKRRDEDVDPVFTFDPSFVSIRPEQRGTVKVVYRPIASETRSSDVYELFTPGGNKVLVSCKGNGVGPKVFVGSNSLNFGDVKVGDKTDRILYINNESNVDAKFQFQTEDGVIFSFDRTEGIVPALSSTHVKIRFEPSQPMNYFKRAFCIVRSTGVQYVNLLGTGYEDRRRPAPFSQKHVDNYRIRQLGGKGDPVPSVKELWEEYFLALSDERRAISVDMDNLFFGAVPKNRLPEAQTISVTNRTDSKVTAQWFDVMKEDLSCTISPDAADILPNTSEEFRVTLKPSVGLENAYLSSKLECFVALKTMRSFRLVTDETFIPPWSITPRVDGHLFPPGSEHFLAKGEIDIPNHRLNFPPCIPGERVYQTFTIANGGDTPLRYSIEEDVTKAFRFQPAVGLVKPRSFSVISAEFAPAIADHFQSRVMIVFNQSQANAVPITLIGNAYEPEVAIEEVDEKTPCLFFKPTSVGSHTTRIVTLRNKSRVPVQFSWNIPEQHKRHIAIQPTSGVLGGNETCPLTVQFLPKQEMPYSLAVRCHLTASASLKPKSGQVATFDMSTSFRDELHLFGEAEEQQVSVAGEYVVGVRGEGSHGAVSFSPSFCDFSTVRVGAESRQVVKINNTSDCDMAYKLVVQANEGVSSHGDGLEHWILLDDELNEDLRLAGKVIVIDNDEGVVPAFASMECIVRFRPPARRFYSYRIVCKSRKSNELPVVGDDAEDDIAGMNAFCEVTGIAAYPSVALSDVRADGRSVADLWAELSLEKVNKHLSADLSKVEAEFLSNGDTDLLKSVPMVPVSFRPSPLFSPFGSETLYGEASQSLARPGLDGRRSTVVVQVHNPGPLPADFVFRMPHELAIDKERWAISGFLSDAEQKRMFILDNDIFTIHPKEGSLAAGESTPVTISYSHEYEGKHDLQVFLQIANGKQVKMLLCGRTLSHKDISISFPDAKQPFVTSEVSDVHYAMHDIPLGEPDAPVQTFPIVNNGALSVAYRVDTAALEELKKTNYDFDVLQLQNAEGVIAPGERVELSFRFCPIEACVYEADLPISFEAEEIDASKSFNLHVSARGFHPVSTDENIEVEKVYGSGSTSNLPTTQKVLLPTQVVKLCPETLDFSAVPTDSTTARIVVVCNTSDVAGASYEWFYRHIPGVLVKPAAGRLHPGQKQVCKVTVLGQSAQVIKGRLECKVVADAVPGIGAQRHSLTGKGSKAEPGIAHTKDEMVASLSRRGSAKGGRPRRMLESLGVKSDLGSTRESVTNATKPDAQPRRAAAPPPGYEPRRAAAPPPGYEPRRAAAPPRDHHYRNQSRRTSHVSQDLTYDEGDDELLYDVESEMAMSARSLRPDSQQGLGQGTVCVSYLELTGQVVNKESVKRIGEYAGDVDAALEPFYFPRTTKRQRENETDFKWTEEMKAFSLDVLTSLVRDIVSEAEVTTSFKGLREKPVPYFVHVRSKAQAKAGSRLPTAQKAELLPKSANPADSVATEGEGGEHERLPAPPASTEVKDVSSSTLAVPEASVETASVDASSSARTRGVEVHLHVDEDVLQRDSLTARPVRAHHDIDILDLESPAPGKQYIAQTDKEREDALKATTSFQDFSHFVLSETITNLMSEAAAGEFNIYKVPRRVVRDQAAKK